MKADNQITRSNYFAHLEGMRGLLAVYVVFHHAFNGLSRLDPVAWLTARSFTFGHMAVAFFIVLSGYSLMKPVVLSGAGTLQGGFRSYLKRRARRILPAYFAAIATGTAVLLLLLRVQWADPAQVQRLRSELSVSSLVSHLFLAHNLVPGAAYTINTPCWSLATEWQIYLLFPLVLLPVWKRWGPAALLLVAFGIGLVPQLVMPEGSNYLKDACLWYAGLFAIGMLAAVAGPRVSDSGGRSRLLLAVALPAGIAYMSLKILYPGVDDGGRFSLQWLKDGACGVVVGVVLVHLESAVAACGRAETQADPFGPRKTYLSRLLESRTAVRLGTFSYSIYITHFPLLRLSNFVSVDWLHLTDEGRFWWNALLIGPLVILFAYGFSLWFEAPFLRKRQSEREPRRFRSLECVPAKAA